MLKKFVTIFGGDPNKRKIQQLAKDIETANQYEAEFEQLSDEALHTKTSEFRRRLVLGEDIDDLAPEAFAVVRDASRRTIGLRPFDIQLICGLALHDGVVAEMRTGEGKTLVATLPIYLNALPPNEKWMSLAAKKWGDNPEKWKFEPLQGVPVGKGVHLVTVNDYLARRDARWMSPIYNALGLSVGVLQMAARTDFGKKAFLVDLEKESPHEDQDKLVSVPRKLAYNADITYGTTNEYGFDYLRDNMAMSLEDRVQRSKDTGGHHFGVVDEVDNVLIDEARTPLIISGPAHEQGEAYVLMAQVVRQLRPEDYEVDEKSRSVSLTEIGEIHVEDILGEPLRDPERPEDVTPEQAQRMGYLEQALRAQFLFKRNKDYLVQSKKVVIIDESTGRLMPGRRWSDGLHQAVEAKEGVPVQSENVTYATVTIQNYYRKYQKLSGMTGTAATEAEEFDKIYKLSVVEIPPNLEYVATRPNSNLEVRKDRDEDGYEYTYYTNKDDTSHKSKYFKRKDYPDVVYRSEEAKFRAITEEIIRYHAQGSPLLIGTTSVELSDTLSGRLSTDSIRKFAQILLARRLWLKKNDMEEDIRVIPDLEFLNRPFGLVPPKDLRELQRQLEIDQRPDHPDNITRLLNILGLAENTRDSLERSLREGIKHQVLNARKHTEESKIIEKAGQFGAVTIATNMAGRGVDIVLGGTLDEEILKNVTRVARNSYTRTNQVEEREELARVLREGASSGYARASHYERLKTWRERFPELPKEDVGIYQDAVSNFDRFLKERDMIHELGGLHVVGSERHDARRIDNQLRGRAARQGDPGSSRFYLSMQDHLMRLFGGQQAEGMMNRLQIDESMPIEMGMVSRIVEGSQTRVEGANFDTRKHLLEYDDVLNAQREAIYGQRDRIFVKDDLTSDVTEMLQAEVNGRIPANLREKDQFWRLVAWLMQIQPNLQFGNHEVYPSFPFLKLIKYIESKSAGDRAALKAVIVEIATTSIHTEKDHLLATLANQLDRTYDNLKEQLDERTDTLDIFVEGMELEGSGEEGMPPRSPREIQEELVSLIRLPLKLSNDDIRKLRNNPKEARKHILEQINAELVNQSMRRITAYMERLLGQELEIPPFELSLDNWEQFEILIAEAIERTYQERESLLLNPENGYIIRDLDQTLNHVEPPYKPGFLLQLLIQISTGAKASFDKRTRKRVWRETSRLSYTHFISKLLTQQPLNDLREEILKHLQGAMIALQNNWGNREVARLLDTSLTGISTLGQARIQQVFSEEEYETIKHTPLKMLPPEQLGKVRNELGRQFTTEILRQLLLHIITEHWVDYLTQVEALRVSIGLEAYAQRDPLVMYKSRASEMFQKLFRDIQVSIVNRMFTFRPRDLSLMEAASDDTDQSVLSKNQMTMNEDPEDQDEDDDTASDSGDSNESNGSSRRRRRRRKRTS